MEGNHRQDSIEEGEEISEEQRIRAESNRLEAIARRRRAALSDPSITNSHDQWRLSKCRKLDLQDIPSVLKEESSANDEGYAEKFIVRLEICSPDSFSATPVPAQGFVFPGEEVALQRLEDWLANVSPSHYTQNLTGGKSCVYKLWDYSPVVRYLRNVKSLVYEEIPWGTFNVVEKLSHSFASGFWMPCRPEHLLEEKVDELIGRLPRKIVETLLPFQLEGVRFGLRRGGRCLIADEMGLGKTLQAIALACCFKDEGSILVVCPAILRFSWAEELERWFPCLPTDIHLVFGHQDNPTHLKKWPKVVVISYKMLHHLQRSLVGRDWNFLIIDESHHLRCSKKISESEEIKVVLDLAAKVQRIVLLSGTPSLSRPYDIFHQINMLWPGLLGKDKFEFAKTYCDVKLTRDYQGNFFKDFSRGTRLDELNILLRQTVMIRRLKEHVMMHLPPKRRQIIGLLLKKSDVVSAKAAMTVDRIEALENDTVTEKSNQSNGNYLNLNIVVRETLGATTTFSGFEAWKQPLCNYIAKEVGIAKLSGFCEWLSLHPFISYPDDARDSELNKNCHKMIIFAHHHKVLDGIQEFICQKGIEFVRIDGNTLPNDSQSAVNSFQLSSEVKIAVIGITAGGVGLNLSSAQTVVFLELPPSSSWMLQAEDRAHRQGQKNAVNIYYFCAKDTVDDTHWQYLNTSLYRVSSTTNGKRDAIREIGVDDISYFESSDLSDGILNKTLGKSTSGSLFSPQHRIVSGLQQNAEISDGCNETSLSNRVSDNQNQGQISSGFEVQPDDATEAKEINTSLVRSLRFEVSQYTERIHLYICTPESEYRPRPLFKSFRLEELDAKSSVIMNNNVAEVDESWSYTEVLLMFINQWKKLRPIQRKKLLRKPLQLPLAVELCYLKEGVNHDNSGLLKGKSKRRNTPFLEISRPLPDNAKWKKVSLATNHGRKEKEYIQGWSMIGEQPLCKLCQSHCCGENAVQPQFFEDLFCNLECYEEYRLRTSNRFLRQELFRIEHGVCTNCQLNCHHLVKCLKSLPVEKRREYIKINAPKLAMRKKLLEKLAKDPSDGNAWHADHIVPVFRGGGECLLENMRTLCVACHYDVTVAQRAERCTARANCKKRLKEILKAVQNEGSVAAASKPKEGNVQEEIVEDELFVKIPGSAYSKQSTGGSFHFGAFFGNEG